MSLIIVVAFLTLVKSYIPKGQILCFDGAIFAGAGVMPFFLKFLIDTRHTARGHMTLEW